MNKIHIGHHKCGSTFLQHLIFPEVDNYVGRYYEKNPHYIGGNSKALRQSDSGEFTNLIKGKKPYEACETILKHYENGEEVLISTELFSKLRPEQLFYLFERYEYDVLLINRNFDDLIKSRSSHKTKDFYLMDKLKNNKIDDEVKLHYSSDNIIKNIKNITILSFDKLFSGDVEEITRLSNYLGEDINDKFLNNINKKINAKRK